MVIHPLRFNINLLLATLLLGAAGCQTPEQKQEKQTATLRIHLETNPLPLGQSEQIRILRHAPVSVTIEKSPFLHEGHLTSASLLETADGFALKLQLNQQGQWLLEQYTSANTRRRIAIRSQFRVGTNVFDRWLAAPMVSNRINDGVLAFTPDADRAEAEALVKGWNNTAHYKPKDKTPKAKAATDKAPDAKFSELP
jgi:preprotein translocase subunit SecD